MLDRLPTDILLVDILGLLDSQSLVELESVSSQFRYLVNDESLWKQLCVHEFNISQDHAYRHKGWKKFYMALKYHTKLYTWGENFDDRLGLTQPQYDTQPGLFRPVMRTQHLRRRHANEVTEPQQVTSLDHVCLIDIIAGGWSFHALDTTGTVWMWGTMQQDVTYRASIGTTRLKRPTELQSDNETQAKIKFRSISSGRGHVIGLARDGTVWHWSNHIMLQKVALDAGAPVAQVVANWNYSSVLTESGALYIVPKPDPIIPSQVLVEPAPTQVMAACVTLQQILPTADPKDKLVQLAGLENHTLVLTQHGLVLKLATVDPDAFSLSPQHHVTELKQFSGIGEHNNRHGIMKRFITGAFHHFAVYTKDKVMLGNIDTTEPETLAELDHQDICKVSFGDYHYGALTNQGQLFTWGNYSSGALGHGQDHSKQRQERPKRVEALNNQFVFAIGFGGWQSAALAIDQ